MSVREHLLALHDELRRLKADGWSTVTVREENLARLRAVVATTRPGEASAPAAAPEPVAAMTAATPALAPEARLASVSPPPPPAPASVRAAAARAGAPAFTLAPVPAPPPELHLPAGDKATQWAALRDLVVNHPVCRAHVRPGKQVVFGVGSLEANIFFCGEAPGADEEIAGEPFVGAAGQLLTRMIGAMGLAREQVYIGNIMNWRPELPTGPGGEQSGNRKPEPAEMAFCLPFLRAQLAIVRPAVIVALGATAAEGLLGPGSFKALREVRSRWHDFGGCPVMVTYHPAYILRNQSNRSKREIWEDLLQVMERTGLPISEKQRGYYRG